MIVNLLELQRTAFLYVCGCGACSGCSRLRGVHVCARLRALLRGSGCGAFLGCCLASGRALEASGLYFSWRASDVCSGSSFGGPASLHLALAAGSGFAGSPRESAGASMACNLGIEKG